MSDPVAAATLVSNLAQTVSAAIVAVLLVGYYRRYGKGYLLHWAAGWMALAVLLAAAIAKIRLDTVAPSAFFLHLGVTLVASVAAYLWILWLVFGSFEIGRQR